MTQSSELRYAPTSRDDGYRESYYVELDGRDGLSVRPRRSNLNGVSSRAWHGHTLEFELPGDGAVDADALDALLVSPEAEALVARLLGGYSSAWGSGDHIGVWGSGDEEQAIAGADALQALILDCPMLPEGAGHWAAWSWMGSARFDVGVLARSSDAELLAIAERLASEALAGYALLELADLEELLKGAREELAQALEEGLPDAEDPLLALAWLDPEFVRLWQAALEGASPSAIKRAGEKIEAYLKDFSA